MSIIRAIIAAVMLGMLSTCASAPLAPAFAHHGPQWAQLSDSVRAWFQTLHNSVGGDGATGELCCGLDDGNEIADEDWDFGSKGYRVRLNGVWVDVPSAANVREGNKYGHAVIWFYGDGRIRCFMAGGGV